MVSAIHNPYKDFSTVATNVQQANRGTGPAVNVYGLWFDSEAGVWQWASSEDELPPRLHLDDLHYTFAGKAGRHEH